MSSLRVVTMGTGGRRLVDEMDDEGMPPVRDPAWTVDWPVQVVGTGGPVISVLFTGPAAEKLRLRPSFRHSAVRSHGGIFWGHMRGQVDQLRAHMVSVGSC